MSLLEQGLYTRLSTFAGLTALISTRVHPMVIPQDETLPAISYQRISYSPDYVMSNASGLARARFQITAWADTYAAVKAVAEQVRLALSDYTGAPSSVTIDWIEMVDHNDLGGSEPGSTFGEYGIALDFFIYFREAQP